MNDDFYCRECNKSFSSKIAHVIESFLHRILECPNCGSKVTIPLKKGKENESSGVGKGNLK